MDQFGPVWADSFIFVWVWEMGGIDNLSGQKGIGISFKHMKVI